MSSQAAPDPADAKEPELPPEVRRRIALEEQLKSLSAPLPYRRSLRIMLVVAGIVTVAAAAYAVAIETEGTDWWFVIAAPLVVCLYFGLTLLAVSFTRGFYRSRLERQLATTIAARKSEELQDKLEENFFTNLVKINFKYIDQYYLQTQLQADKSFLLSACAAVISLLVILAGILILFTGRGVDGAKEAGYVATAAGALGQFIAAVFFYLYNRTVTKMSEYHQKLVLTQNVSLALKISDELPAPDQVAARLKLIDYLSKDINLLLVARPSSYAPKHVDSASGQSS